MDGGMDEGTRMKREDDEGSKGDGRCGWAAWRLGRGEPQAAARLDRALASASF